MTDAIREAVEAVQDFSPSALSATAGTLRALAGMSGGANRLHLLLAALFIERSLDGTAFISGRPAPTKPEITSTMTVTDAMVEAAAEIVFATGDSETMNGARKIARAAVSAALKMVGK